MTHPTPLVCSRNTYICGSTYCANECLGNGIPTANAWVDFGGGGHSFAGRNLRGSTTTMEPSWMSRRRHK